MQKSWCRRMPKTAWSVLTDYDNLARFVPEMKSSRVTSSPGQPKRVEQRGKSGMLSFFTPEYIVLQMEETPYERIKFNKVSGDVRSMRGEWQIVGDGNPVRVVLPCAHRAQCFRCRPCLVQR